MFERIIAALTSKTETPMPEADARHALGALLVRVAKADGAYLFQEIEEIDHLLANLYVMNAIDAARMRAECERLEQAMPETKELADILRNAVSETEKNLFVSALWKVADADGQRHQTEQQVVQIASETFGMGREAATALRP